MIFTMLSFRDEAGEINEIFITALVLARNGIILFWYAAKGNRIAKRLGRYKPKFSSLFCITDTTPVEPDTHIKIKETLVGHSF